MCFNHICLFVVLCAFTASPVRAQVASPAQVDEPDNLFNQDIVRIKDVVRVSDAERALRNQRREAVLEKIDYILSRPENELDIWKDDFSRVILLPDVSKLRK